MPETTGRYRLVSLIGEGGMGKVYKGFDASLERHVAIKVLPADVVSDPGRVGRFIHEARTASALNHPNVITVYDIGEERFEGHPEAARYIAMELVDGKTLRQLLDEGSLDLRRGIRIALQVAEGLGAAHAAGVIHRDLKPENIMVSNSGFAKVLDFGLAKLRIRDDGAPSDSIRTLAKQSEAGVVMGTVGYMSPEQAQGQPVDHRSDVFSLGCVLYEIVSGRRAFRGDSSVDTLHKIIYSDPETLRSLRPELPPELARIVRKALAKDPEDRYQTVKDLAIDLRELVHELDSGLSLSGAMAPGGERSSRSPLAGWIAIIAGVAAIALIAIVFLSRNETSAIPEGVTAASVTQVRRITAGGNVIGGAISPDGKFVAFIASDGGRQGIQLRQIASGQTITVIPPERQAVWGVAFTPDSGSIYFGIKRADVPGGAIFQVSTLGGAPRKIVEPIESQPTFSPDGRRMAFLLGSFPDASSSSLMVAGADGSEVRALATVRAPEFLVPVFFAGASWSPDGSMIAVSVNDISRRRARLVTVDATTGAMATIADPGWHGAAQTAWMPDQKGLVLVADKRLEGRGQIWYVPYPSGTPVPITKDVFGYRTVSVTADGQSLLTVLGDFSSDLWSVRESTALRRLTSAKLEGWYGVDSMPGSRIVFSSLGGGKLDIWSMREDGSERVQLTRDEFENRFPVASPDGRFVVYQAGEPDGYALIRIDADGSDRRVLARLVPGNGIAISPDGKNVVFRGLVPGEGGQKQGPGLAIVPIEGGPPRVLTRERFAFPAFSPDGSTIAGYLQDAQTSKYFLATMPVGGATITKIVENVSFSNSRIHWTPDGKGLIVNSNAGDYRNLWMVPLDGSARRQLTRFDERMIASYAPMRDGKGWIISRGDLQRDAVLMTNFRP